MARNKQFDRKKMLETIDGLIEEIKDTDIHDIDGGNFLPALPITCWILCYAILPI